MRVVLRCLLMTTMTATFAAGQARAQSPSPATVANAKQRVEEGRAAQERGAYDEAIELYQKAYALVPHPALFFNMAQAHRLAGRFAQALALYERYLGEAPTGPQAPTAREWVADLKPRIAADEARKAEEARALRQAQADEARKREQAQADEARKARDAGAAGAARDAGEGRARTLRIAGIASGATGVVSLGIGIGFAFHGASLSNKADREQLPEDSQVYKDGHRANSIAWTGVIGGAVLLGAGAGLYWWGHSEGHAAERITLAPVLSDRHVGFVLSGAL
jgi:tetratricopeptide (TPR) repeat protein